MIVGEAVTLSVAVAGWKVTIAPFGLVASAVKSPETKVKVGDVESMTVRLSETVAEPLLFVAVTVEVAVALTAVGVPLITPVLVFRERPAGSGGETA